MTKIIGTTLLTFSLLFIGSNSLAAKQHSQQVDAVRAVINKMNQSISQRDLDSLISAFAPGSIRVDLFPAHNYGNRTDNSDSHIKSSGLIERWQAVAPMLFQTTSAYERTATDMTVHIDEKMALCWVKVSTKSTPLNKQGQVEHNKFTEAVLLTLTDNQWKIVAITNNRQDVSPYRN